MNNDFLFTSESVSEGHPDKIADQISDAILDAILKEDIHARVACETLVKTGMVLIAGEISTNAWVDMEQIARDVILRIGYNSSQLGFDGNTCSVLNAIGKQSHEIAQGVDKADPMAQGAGDQGIMFGYATNETPTYMPAAIYYAHRLMERHAFLRKSKALPWLGPDAKSQVTLRYIDNQPQYVDTIVLSTQHAADIDQETLEHAIKEELIDHVIPKKWLSEKTKFLINPSGSFTIGGPVGDCGLTGRKIIVDTYGGAAHHGGGAFSGKDPSKVDRSAAYMARYIAKNIVAAKLADRCEVQISYAIGYDQPTSIMVNTFGTGKIPEDQIVTLIDQHFDLRPHAIILTLDLLRPIYQKTATYGHFGRENEQFPWEKTDQADKLAQAANL